MHTRGPPEGNPVVGGSCPTRSELGSDILLRIIQSDHITVRAWKIELSIGTCLYQRAQESRNGTSGLCRLQRGVLMPKQQAWPLPITRNPRRRAHTGDETCAGHLEPVLSLERSASDCQAKHSRSLAPGWISTVLGDGNLDARAGRHCLRTCRRSTSPWRERIRVGVRAVLLTNPRSNP